MLRELLKAKRPDLLDGFPLKAAFKALTAEGTPAFKHAYLNELLATENIKVILTKQRKFLIPGFREAGIAGAMTFSDGSIEIRVNRKFFTEIINPLDRSLRFQSISAHELVHRQQFVVKTLNAEEFKSEDELNSIEYINDPYELEAMAAEVAHDSLTSQYASALFAQPRLEDLTTNARHFRPDAMKKFRAAVFSMKE